VELKGSWVICSMLEITCLLIALIEAFYASRRSAAVGK